MKTIETIATVTPERTVTIQLPPDVEPGDHKVVVVVGEIAPKKIRGKRIEMPTVSVGEWPKDLSLRREDMYGDDGR